MRFLLAGCMWRYRGAAGELPRWRKIHRLLARGLACTTTRAKLGDDGEWDSLFRYPRWHTDPSASSLSEVFNGCVVADIIFTKIGLKS